MSWIDNSLSIDSKMLLLRARRAEVIASNLVNADTPGYKARDVDFSAALSDARAARTTHSRHMGANMDSFNVVKRDGFAPSANGNNVKREFEQSEFTQNSVQYLASLRFLNGSVKGIMGALKGE